ncbi:TPA: hypothetical protein HLU32_16650 [Escherichia coli]|nr:hypothetical protein [Escherichia coli]HAJ4256143.1 hypothetical protein [Escherichia coli]HAJ4382444.1 hypothetical protein [Escherichia coli]
MKTATFSSGIRIWVSQAIWSLWIHKVRQILNGTALVRGIAFITSQRMK